MTRLTADVDSLNQLFTEGVTDLLGDLVMILAIITVMLWMDVQLTLVSLLTVPLLVGATTGFVKARERIRPGAHPHRAHQRFLAGTFRRRTDGSDLQRRSKVDAELSERSTSSIDKREYRNDLLLRGLLPARRSHRRIGIALIIWYGGYRVMQNTPDNTVLTLGALVAFIQYSQRFVSTNPRHLRKYNVLQAAVVASHRIFKTLDCRLQLLTPEKPLKAGTGAWSHRISERLVCLQG